LCPVLAFIQIEVISYIAKSQHASSPSIGRRVRSENDRASRFFESAMARFRASTFFAVSKVIANTCSNRQIKPTMRHAA
jgi:hypothetical protein